MSRRARQARAVCLVIVPLVTVTALAQAPERTSAEALFEAARSGNRARVTAILDGGVDVNAASRYGVTAVGFAADKGQLEVVRLLVERGASLDVTTRSTDRGPSISRFGAGISTAGEALGVQLRPDVIAQVLGTGSVVEYERAPYYNVPPVLRVDLCLPRDRVHPARDCSGGRVLQRIGDIIVLHSALGGSPNTLDPQGRITCRNANAPQVDCAGWRGDLRLYACFGNPDVKTYSVSYRWDDIDGPDVWHRANQSHTLNYIPLLWMGGVSVGPSDQIVHAEGGSADKIPTYTNHEGDSVTTAQHLPPISLFLGMGIQLHLMMAREICISETMIGSVTGCRVIRSTDNGQTWSTPVVAVSGNDKNWMVADQTTGPYSGYIYTGMTPGNFARSTNLGASWTTTNTFVTQSLPGLMVCIGPNGATDGGVVYVVTNSGSAFASTYTFYASTNGGQNFTLKSAQNFSNYVGTNVGGRNSVQNMRTRPYPFITADQTNGSYSAHQMTLPCCFFLATAHAYSERTRPVP